MNPLRSTVNLDLIAQNSFHARLSYNDKDIVTVGRKTDRATTNRFQKQFGASCNLTQITLAEMEVRDSYLLLEWKG